MIFRLIFLPLFSLVAYASVSAQGFGSAMIPDGPGKPDSATVHRVAELIPEPSIRITTPEIFVTRIPGEVHLSPSPVDLQLPEYTPFVNQNFSNIGTLLDQQPGLQMQTTTAGPNGSVLRIRGFSGRYTQLMRDGFPVFGGLLGNFDLSQISPIDLDQIEIVKGPASTLYGGDGAAGTVNLVSKDPWDPDQNVGLINVSSLGVLNAGFYGAKQKGDHFAGSCLVGTSMQLRRDFDGDGFSDVPDANRLHLNPRLVWSPGTGRLKIALGATWVGEGRSAGDMALVRGETVPDSEYYLNEITMGRTATQFKADYSISGGLALGLRNSQSWSSRKETLREFFGGLTHEFGGRQFNSYTDLELRQRSEKNAFNLGFNANLESFREMYNVGPRVRDQQIRRFAAYFIDQLKLSRIVSLDGGIRAEYVTGSSSAGENEGKLFILPRIFGLFQLSPRIQARVGGSSGYRMPSVFSEESEMLGYRGVLPVNFSAVRPEQTLGGEAGISYMFVKSGPLLFVKGEVRAFYMQIKDLVFLQPLGFATPEFLNYDALAISRGFEANLQAVRGKFELIAQYALNDTYLDDSTSYTALTLVPEHAIKGVFAFRPSDKWNFALTANWKSSQWLTGGIQSRSLLVLGATVSRDFNRFTLFANASNLLNARQSRFESMLGFPYNTPQFTQVWAPLDGFYCNAGVKVKLW